MAAAAAPLEARFCRCRWLDGGRQRRRSRHTSSSESEKVLLRKNNVLQSGR